MKQSQTRAYSSKAIANEFIRLAQKDGGLTHMQIQKLVYFAHAENLVKYGRPLVKGVFQAWPFGPVDIGIYLELRGSGRERITTEIPDTCDEIDDKSRELVRKVYNEFGDMQAFKLSEMSHKKDGPWAQVYQKGRSNPIPNDIIKKYSRDIIDGGR